MNAIGQYIDPKFRNSNTRTYGHAVACKCEICTCGTHKCSIHHPEQKHYDPESLHSQYDQSYRAHTINNVPTRDQNAPKQLLSTAGVPFNAVSSNQADFVPWKTSPASSAKPKNTMTDVTGKPIGDNEDRNFSTEQRKQFDYKGLSKRESYAPPNRESIKLPFEGKTTQNEDFKSWKGVKPATPYQGDNRRHTNPNEDRDFRTEAQLSFVGHPTQRVLPYKPTITTRRAVPFNGETTNRSDFQKWSAKPSSPFIPPQFRLDGGKDDRDFRSISAVEYTPKQGERQKNFAPPPMHTNQQPFNAVSSHQADFVPWKTSPASSAKPKNTMTDVTGKPIGDNEDRNFSTEQRKQFDYKGLSKRESYAPPNRESIKLPFEGKTTQNEDFKSWKGVKPATPYQGDNRRHTNPNEDRDFRTEAQLSFVGHPTQRALPFKPTITTRRAVPFNGETTHGADFKKWEPEPCPANSLPASQSYAPDGHQLYAKVPNDGWTPAVVLK